MMLFAIGRALQKLLSYELVLPRTINLVISVRRISVNRTSSLAQKQSQTPDTQHTPNHQIQPTEPVLFVLPSSSSSSSFSSLSREHAAHG